LGADHRRPRLTGETTLFDRRAKYAFFLACFTLVAGGIGFRAATEHLNVYLQKKPVKLREHFDNISTRLGSWEMAGGVHKLSQEMIEELGTEWYLDRQYVQEGMGQQRRMMNLHIAYYTGMIDAVPHIPDRCFVAGGYQIHNLARNYPLQVSRTGWRTDPDRVNQSTGQPYELAVYQDPITGRTTAVRMPMGDFVLRTTEFVHPDTPDTRVFSGYFFIANGRLAATPEEVKLLAFKRSEEYAYYCKVQFTSGGDGDFTAERFTAVVADLLTPLLPQLMRCLPDWAEVEDRMTEASPESGS
jgi:hypothetical protein